MKEKNKNTKNQLNQLTDIENKEEVLTAEKYNITCIGRRPMGRTAILMLIDVETFKPDVNVLTVQMS
jgi:hypothetical protein